MKIVISVFAALAAVMSTGAAQAQEKVKFAYLRTQVMMPFLYAEQKGYFGQEGLAIEFVPVQGGPAVAAAIASGSAHIGYAAPTPIVMARQEGQPYRFFIGLEWERSPDYLWGPLHASERSGVRSFRELAGKTLLVGPAGGLCELAFRDWLAKSGVAWDKVKVLYIPFPQHQAALELGNADAACTPEPFYTAIANSKVKPALLGMGYLAEEKRKYVIDGLFATEAWIKANPKVIDALKRATVRAIKDLNADPQLVRKTLLEDFKLPASLVARLRTGFDPNLAISAADLEPIIEAMRRNGMLRQNLTAADMVHTGK